MDWETLLALVGIYIILLTNLVYQWLLSKRLMKLGNTNKRLLESNEKVLSLIGDIIVETSDKKEGNETQKKDYKIKFNLPTTW